MKVRRKNECLAMIVISVAIYVIINFIDHSDEKSALAIKYGAFYPPKIEYKQEYWRFLTANFVHVDLVHIFMNCYALYYLELSLNLFWEV